MGELWSGYKIGYAVNSIEVKVKKNRSTIKYWIPSTFLGAIAVVGITACGVAARGIMVGGITIGEAVVPDLIIIWYFTQVASGIFTISSNSISPKPSILTL